MRDQARFDHRSRSWEYTFDDGESWRSHQRSRNWLLLHDFEGEEADAYLEGLRESFGIPSIWSY